MESHWDKPHLKNSSEAGGLSLAGGLAVAQRIVVGLGELKVSDKPNTVLTAYMLGSCLAVAIYDPEVKIGGLLHAMLPDSSVDPVRAQEHPGMFLDVGLPALFRAVSEMGAQKARLRIYVVGAARVIDDSHVFNIGDRNCVVLDNFLRAEGLQATARHVGGHANRTIYFHITTGQAKLKVSGIPGEIQLC